MAKSKKSALESVGHGKVRSRKVRPSQETITIKGEKKQISSGNRRNGKVFWYKRSDGGIALRNFKRDRNRNAKRRSIKGKGFSGDR